MPTAGRALLPLAPSRGTASPGTQNSCFFRSGPPDGSRKVLLKITDRCDLACAHCFVSAGRDGEDMPAEALNPEILGKLIDARVSNVTITGGEPFVHPQILDITARLVHTGLEATICTNGVGITEDAIRQLVELRRVKVNVSMDGFSQDSHGRFRGRRESFEVTVANLRRLSQAGLLKGVLCTPNALGTPEEYGRLANFAGDLGAAYLLMNPLSNFGRGVRSRRALAASDHAMRDIQASVNAAASLDLDVTYVRFPNRPEPLAGCIAGDILYVFVNGDVAVCPYLAFATDNPGSAHDRNEFIVGNLFADNDLAEHLDGYSITDRYPQTPNPTCTSCKHDDRCGKGCPAAVVAAGGRLGDLDAEVCPTVNQSG